MLKKLLPPSRKRGDAGLATIEMIPIMVVIAILLNFALGFWGVIHTGILNNIASRNYAFETFRNRTNLLYFHDAREPNVSTDHFKRYNTRVHGIASENRASSGSTDAVVTIRHIGFGQSPQTGSDQAIHNPGDAEERGIFEVQDRVRNDSIDAAPVWVRPMYGLCLNAKCAQ